MTLVIDSGIRPSLRVDAVYNHYSLLATIEDSFGLPLLGQAKRADPLSAFFSPANRRRSP